MNLSESLVLARRQHDAGTARWICNLIRANDQTQLARIPLALISPYQFKSAVNVGAYLRNAIKYNNMILARCICDYLANEYGFVPREFVSSHLFLDDACRSRIDLRGLTCAQLTSILTRLVKTRRFDLVRAYAHLFITRRIAIWSNDDTARAVLEEYRLLRPPSHTEWCASDDAIAYVLNGNALEQDAYKYLLQYVIQQRPYQLDRILPYVPFNNTLIMLCAYRFAISTGNDTAFISLYAHIGHFPQCLRGYAFLFGSDRVRSIVPLPMRINGELLLQVTNPDRIREARNLCGVSRPRRALLGLSTRTYDSYQDELACAKELQFIDNLRDCILPGPNIAAIL